MTKAKMFTWNGLHFTEDKHINDVCKETGEKWSPIYKDSGKKSYF